MPESIRARTEARPATRTVGDRIRHNLELLGDLPALSPVVAQLSATLGREDVEVFEVETIMQRDPVITAKVIAAANAAAYASYTPTTTIRGALMKLGLVRVRRLAMLVSLYNKVDVRPALQTLFSRHSLAVAHAAETIVRCSPGGPAGAIEPEVVFLAGLLHDIGLLVIASHYPKECATVRSHAEERGMSLWEAEVALLGIDHGEIGGRLAEHWSFPKEIATAIWFHHRHDAAPDDARRAAVVIRVADAACASEPTWDMAEGDSVSLEDPSVTPLGLDDVSIQAVIEETRTEVKRAEAIIESAG